MRIAVYPGTFDPVTFGHLDLVERGRKHVDKLILAILKNEDKRTLFSVAERAALLREAVAPWDNVVVDAFDGLLVDYAKRSAREAGLDKQTSFVRGDIFETDFSDATVITTFLLPSMNLRLRPRFLAMKPGTRIVANTFAIGDWQPDETVTIEPCERWCKAMLWVVPAKVAGSWRLGDRMLTLTQQYQMVSGSLGTTVIADGKLNGETITFTAGGRTYSGRVNGDRITGSGWSAIKAPGPVSARP